MCVAYPLIAAVACLVLAAIAEAQVPPTSDLIHFAGGDSSVILGAERFEVGSHRWYVHLGVVLWTARAGASLPVPLTLTNRGLPQVLFFEPAPLLDLMLPEGEDALRATLQVPLNQELPAGDAASLPALVAFKRRAVRDQMRAFDLKGLADVVALNICQQRVERHALTPPDAFPETPVARTPTASCHRATQS